ncbi:MAG TPA: hypothetical protein PKA37_04720, partial [Planctomycetota bacterium]|nr:hypothetical protein [Planctomycetota bacterium]
TGGGAALNVLFMDAAGNVVSGPTVVATPGVVPGGGSMAACANANGFMLVYDGVPTGLVNRSVYYIIYSLTGTVVSSGTASTLTGFDNTRPRCATSTHGNFAIVWLQRSFPNTTGVMLRRYSANGTAIDASEFRVDNAAQSLGRMDGPDVGYWPSGRLVVAWHDGDFNAAAGVGLTPDGFGQGILGRWFENNLQALTNNVVLSSTTANDQFECLVSVDDRNRCMFAWCGDLTTNLVDAWCRAYDDTGMPLDASDINLTPTNTTSDQLAMSIDGSSNGEFIVTWMDAVSSLGQPAPRVSYARLSQQRSIVQTSFVETAGSTSQGQFFARTGCDQYGNFTVAYQLQDGTSLGSTTACGVVLKAFKRNMIALSASQVPLGGGVSVLIDSPSDANNIYVVGLAAGGGPTPVDSRTLKLSNDALLNFVLGPGLSNNNGVFFNFAGVLSSTGTTSLPGILVPNVPSLVGVTLHVAFVTGGGFALPSGVNTVSDSVTLTII